MNNELALIKLENLKEKPKPSVLPDLELYTRGSGIATRGQWKERHRGCKECSVNEGGKKKEERKSSNKVEHFDLDIRGKKKKVVGNWPKVTVFLAGVGLIRVNERGLKSSAADGKLPNVQETIR